MQVNLEAIIDFFEYVTTPLKTPAYYLRQQCKDARWINFGKDYLPLAEQLHEFVYRKDISETKTNKLLQRFKKQNTLTDALNEYHITRDYGGGYNTRFTTPQLYYDAPYSFILCQKQDQPLAIIAFKPERKAINIVQLQGVRGQQKKLQPIKWERMLLTLTYEWAQQHQIHEVRVTPYEQNEWELVRDNGKIRYDVTAKRTGFKYDEKQKKYVKKTS